MIGRLTSVVRGMALLRFPEVVRDLGERRFHIKRIQHLRERYPKSKIDANVYLTPGAEKLITLGDGCSICHGTILTAGDGEPGGTISIGARSWIGQYNNLRSGGGAIAIGNDCLVSQFCTLVAGNHGLKRDRIIRDQPLDSKRVGVTLGDDVWLGAGVVVLPGVTIGRGAVIGVNAVVTNDVAEYEIHAGVPARKVAARN